MENIDQVDNKNNILNKNEKIQNINLKNDLYMLLSQENNNNKNIQWDDFEILFNQNDNFEEIMDEEEDITKILSSSKGLGCWFTHKEGIN